ncbi:hypothetical protein [Thermoactinomyces mirandus]|uniref:hypothetical protein n=1 Tax=Thermoactinomyces mirandus TaxID=2756294 RepID=UPI0015EFB397|nr:hypothetical protein [Thermoactinomyces mirandus]
MFYNRIWRIGTGIGAIVFELIAPFVTGLPFVAAIAGKVPWLGKALPKMFASAAGGGTDQSIIDFLKGQFSWKKTTIVAGLCFVFALGGNYIGNYSDDIIKWINNRNVPNLEQSFISNNGNPLSSTVPKHVGDTPLGQWLQKFTSNSSDEYPRGLGTKPVVPGDNVVEPLPLIQYKINPSLTPMRGTRETAINRAWKLEQELVRLTGRGTYCPMTQKTSRLK